MLFINSQPVDKNCGIKCSNTNSLKRHTAPHAAAASASNSAYLKKVTVALLAIYVGLSLALAFFRVTVSLTSLVVPAAVALCALAALSGAGYGSAASAADTNLWFCSIAATFGSLGKAIAILCYSMIFGFGDALSTDGYSSRGTRQQANARLGGVSASARSDHRYTQFFVVVLVVECCFVALIGCLRCNLGFMKRACRYAFAVGGNANATAEKA